MPLLQGGEKQGKVSKLMKNEVLMLNIGSMCTGARVVAVRVPFFMYLALLQTSRCVLPRISNICHG